MQERETSLCLNRRKGLLSNGCTENPLTLRNCTIPAVRRITDPLRTGSPDRLDGLDQLFGRDTIAHDPVTADFRFQEFRVPLDLVRVKTHLQPPRELANRPDSTLCQTWLKGWYALPLGLGSGLISAGRIATMLRGPDHSGATRSIRNHERAMEFTIEFSPDARDQLRSLKKRDQQIVVDAIAAQLTHQADQPTANRKLL